MSTPVHGFALHDDDPSQTTLNVPLLRSAAATAVNLLVHYKEQIELRCVVSTETA